MIIYLKETGFGDEELCYFGSKVIFSLCFSKPLKMSYPLFKSVIAHLFQAFYPQVCVNAKEIQQSSLWACFWVDYVFFPVLIAEKLWNHLLELIGNCCVYLLYLCFNPTQAGHLIPKILIESFVLFQFWNIKLIFLSSLEFFGKNKTFFDKTNFVKNQFLRNAYLMRNLWFKYKLIFKKLKFYPPKVLKKIPTFSMKIKIYFNFQLNLILKKISPAPTPKVER